MQMKETEVSWIAAAGSMALCTQTAAHYSMVMALRR